MKYTYWHYIREINPKAKHKVEKAKVGNCIGYKHKQMCEDFFEPQMFDLETREHYEPYKLIYVCRTLKADENKVQVLQLKQAIEKLEKKGIIEKTNNG